MRQIMKERRKKKGKSFPMILFGLHLSWSTFVIPVRSSYTKSLHNGTTGPKST